MIIYVYEEQQGCVKLSGISTATFSITNGTRQGSVMSPTLFAVYLDGLQELYRAVDVMLQVCGWVLQDMLMTWHCLLHPEKQWAKCWRFVKIMGLIIILNSPLMRKFMWKKLKQSPQSSPSTTPAIRKRSSLGGDSNTLGPWASSIWYHGTGL